MHLSHIHLVVLILTTLVTIESNIPLAIAFKAFSFPYMTFFHLDFLEEEMGLCIHPWQISKLRLQETLSKIPSQLPRNKTLFHQFEGANLHPYWTLWLKILLLVVRIMKKLALIPIVRNNRGVNQYFLQLLIMPVKIFFSQNELEDK